MNIVEALKIAKEQGKKVRPVGCEKAYMVYEKYGIFKGEYIVRRIKNNTIIRNYGVLGIEDVMSDWEVVKEKPSKQTQYKIDSMKFQIVRHCENRYSCMECRLAKKCERDGYMSCNYAPKTNLLDNWSLKEIVEAYHILKKEGEI